MGGSFPDGLKRPRLNIRWGGATVVMLIPARTDTKAFHDYILGRAELRFIRGRLKFGGGVNSAPFPSMLVIFRQEEQNDEED